MVKRKYNLIESVPDPEIATSLNSLQEVQWEINLDLLACFFDVVFADGKKLSLLEGERASTLAYQDTSLSVNMGTSFTK